MPILTPSFGAFARTRVARRIVLLFVLCALVPVASLAAVSFVSVSGQLRERAGERLYRGSKSSGLTLLQRLQSLEWDLRRVAQQTPRMERDRSAGTWTIPNDGDRFEAVGFTGPGTPSLPRATPPAAAALAHMRLGKAAVLVEAGARGTSRVLMVMMPDTADPGFLAWAEIDAHWLWGPPITPDAAPESGLCVFRGPEPIFCPPRTAPRVLAAISARAGADITFEWDSGEGHWLAASWPLFMRAYFGGPDWKIITSEERDEVMAPLRDFTRAYLLILAASLVLVGLLSLVTIRRNMEPLADLHEATRRIAAKEFDIRVDVRSRDEFRALADSFNAMAHAIGRHFEVTNGMLELGQRLLSARDPEAIARTALDEVRAILPCHAAAVLLRPGFAGSDLPTGWVVGERGIEPAGAWSPDEIAGMFADSNSRALPVIGAGTGPLPGRLTSMGASSHLLYPIRSGRDLMGTLVLGLHRELNGDDALVARQLTDNVAIALAGAGVLAELNEFSWGALRALARAIDAKSAWTAGHSERVTELALGLGRKLQLDAAALEQIERGGLLHDIGKIGVSSRVLDQPGPLTPAQWEEMRSHPTVGGRILEPIARYADILPIVLHHHERWDGGGYPDHLAGEAIPFLARLLALADVYDALTSDRPYRPGMTGAGSLDLIEAALGTQFDPAIGRVFVEMMRAGEPGAERRPAWSVEVPGPVAARR